jgi:hypothetical protein
MHFIIEYRWALIETSHVSLETLEYLNCNNARHTTKGGQKRSLRIFRESSAMQIIWSAIAKDALDQVHDAS